jgi:hypothetical protein
MGAYSSKTVDNKEILILFLILILQVTKLVQFA